jgi:hypothetical protein
MLLNKIQAIERIVRTSDCYINSSMSFRIAIHLEISQE